MPNCCGEAGRTEGSKLIRLGFVQASADQWDLAAVTKRVHTWGNFRMVVSVKDTFKGRTKDAFRELLEMESNKWHVCKGIFIQANL